MVFVECNEFGQVNIADAVAVSHTERIIIKVFLNSLQATAGHRGKASINQCHAPVLRARTMDFHSLLAKVDRDVGSVQQVVREILFDRETLVPTANDEIADSM